MSDQPKRALAAMRWKQAVETLQDAYLLVEALPDLPLPPNNTA